MDIQGLCVNHYDCDIVEGHLSVTDDAIINVVKLHCTVMHNILVTLQNRFPLVFTDLSLTQTHTHTSLCDSRHNHMYDTVTMPLIRAAKEMEMEFLFLINDGRESCPIPAPLRVASSIPT